MKIREIPRILSPELILVIGFQESRVIMTNNLISVLTVDNRIPYPNLSQPC